MEDIINEFFPLTSISSLLRRLPKHSGREKNDCKRCFNFILTLKALLPQMPPTNWIN